MTLPVLTPNEEHALFHMAIGMAISQWAHVENGLLNLNVTAFGEKNADMIGASFHAIENFRTKLAFTDQTIRQSAIFKTLLPHWVDIRDEVQRLSALRNKIAHGRTIGYHGAPPGRCYAIVPISYDKPSRFKSNKALPPSSALCVRDIDLAARQFSKAASILFHLNGRAQGYEGQLAGAVLREPQRQTLAQLRRHLDQVHQRPAKSSRG